MGNSFNLVLEISKICRILDEHNATKKRIEALTESLQELSVKMTEDPANSAFQFNNRGGEKVTLI